MQSKVFPLHSVNCIKIFLMSFSRWSLPFISVVLMEVARISLRKEGELANFYSALMQKNLYGRSISERTTNRDAWSL